MRQVRGRGRLLGNEADRRIAPIPYQIWADDWQRARGLHFHEGVSETTQLVEKRGVSDLCDAEPGLGVQI
jgi:hypothetical protein